MHWYSSIIAIQLVVQNHTKRFSCNSISVGWWPKMIALVLARQPSISILEIPKNAWHLGLCMTLSFYHFTGRNGKLCHICVCSNISRSLSTDYCSDIKLQHALCKIFIPKFSNNYSARESHVSQIHYSANFKARRSILTQRPLKSMSQILLSTGNIVQSFLRQCSLNASGSFTILREKCKDGWGTEVMCQPYYKCSCKVMRGVVRRSIFSLKSLLRQRKAQEVPQLLNQRPERRMILILWKIYDLQQSQFFYLYINGLSLYTG